MSIPATFEVSQASNLMPTAEMFNFVQLRSRKKTVAIAHKDATLPEKQLAVLHAMLGTTTTHPSSSQKGYDSRTR